MTKDEVYSQLLQIYQTSTPVNGVLKIPQDLFDEIGRLYQNKEISVQPVVLNINGQEVPGYRFPSSFGNITVIVG